MAKLVLSSAILNSKEELIQTTVFSENGKGAPLIDPRYLKFDRASHER